MLIDVYFIIFYLLSFQIYSQPSGVKCQLLYLMVNLFHNAIENMSLFRMD